MNPKTIEQHWADWEKYVFGFGYGTGELYTIPALKKFFSCIQGERRYDFQILGKELTPTVAWLLINILCHADILEYGTSPRYGWLTKEGESLKAFIDSNDEDTLYTFLMHDETVVHCYPDHCNCDVPMCQSPFWEAKKSRTNLSNYQ